MVTKRQAWLELVAEGRGFPLAVLLGAVLLYAMNALLTSTIAPSAIREFDAIAYITWPTAAFFASSIAAASGAGLLKARVGARSAFIIAAVIFCVGAIACASAASIAQFVAGRFVQGAGGGLLSALAYVLIQSTFPQATWPSAFALFSGTWGVAVLLGPMIGGIFADLGSWRGAFLFVASAAALLSIAAAKALNSDRKPGGEPLPAFPFGRLALLAACISALSAAQVASLAWVMAALIALALAAVASMLRFDRAAIAPLFPSDAFSWRGVVGPGLWMTLLLSTANDPFPLYGPLFLQELHGLKPLAAGYLVALEAMAWTIAAMSVANWSERAASILLVFGPVLMGLGLAGIAWLMPSGTIAYLIAPICCSGAGIGSCWAFMSQRVMRAAKPGESDITASAVPTVQLFGLGFGGAVAGLVANIAGYASGLNDAASRAAAFWVPASFVLITIAAAAAGLRMVFNQRFTR
jgi:MFS family permease